VVQVCRAVAGARKTTADALEFSETQDDRGINDWRTGRAVCQKRKGTERLHAPRHAKISDVRSSTHVATAPDRRRAELDRMK